MLTLEDKEIIKHLGYPKLVSLSSGSYLIKGVLCLEGFKELLGYELAKLFNLFCPKYELIKLENNYYSLSEDINKYGKFVTASSIVTYEDVTTSLYEIWNSLESKYSNTPELMGDLIKIYIFDMLFLNYDRSVDNWGMLENNDGAKVVIFDNEAIFTHPELLSMGVEEKAITRYEDFRMFLRESSLEFTHLFKYYFDLITPEYLTKIIREINGRLDMSLRLVIDEEQEIIDMYKANRDKLSKIYTEERSRPNAR